ncbi:MAG TPA: HIT domain-containing protein [Bdellovibrionota bacterium]|jgi:ATP adenylyltransferase|nr:HIT domain-containing protein [Bdellovibrionota bacterium]
MKPQKRDNLWAPWRLEYIHKKKLSDACPFCTALKQKPSVKNLVLYKDASVAVIMNKFPYNPYHLLVIPRAHAADLGDLPAEVSARLAKCVQKAYEAVREVVRFDGANIGINLGTAAGAGIPGHLHWHIVPRWNSDTNFMPILAETKAIPTHNAKVYESLSKVFDSFADRMAED